MSEWVDLAKRKPTRMQICDFLCAPDPGEPVWMMCGATLAEFSSYDALAVWWRPAEALPPEIDAEIDRLSA